MRWTIDFLKWIWSVLPRPMREPSTVQALWVWTKPLRDLQAQLQTWYVATDYALLWNGQTIKLERLLRNEFGSEDIRLLNIIPGLSPMAFGPNAEPMDYWGPPSAPQAYIGPAGGFSSITAKVIVPSYLQGEEPRLRALVNKYKIEQVQYEIEYV
jgi:hypothetical protein